MKKGSVIHIKDSFFELVQDKNLMSNYENGGYRPHYLCLLDKNDPTIIWAVPLSSRAEKYKKIFEQKFSKNGRCDTIVISKFCGKECAFLIQNAFPIKEDYIDHVHIVNGSEVIIGKSLQSEIQSKLLRCIEISRNCKNILFVDVEHIKKLLK